MKHGESRVEIKVVGLNQLKLLSFIKRNGIELFDINLTSHEEMIFWIKKNKLKLFKKILKNKNINYEILSRSGFDNILHFFINNYGIFISLLIFLIFLVILNNFSYFVKVDGCTTLDDEKISEYVEQNLKQKAYRKGEIDCSEIERQLRNEFDTISFVSVIKRGCYVVVDIKEKLTNTETDKNLAELSAKSSCRGYVSSVEIYQGTAAVKVGDFVKVGSDLILPYVLDSKGDKEYVVPRGKIEISCFFDSTISHSDQVVTFERTGKSQTIYSLTLFGLEIYKHDEKSSFENFEEIENEQDLSHNNILPLKYKKKTIYELKEVIKQVDFDAEKQNYLEKAKQNVFQQLPNGVIITNERQNICGEGDKKFVQYIVEGKIVMSF